MKRSKIPLIITIAVIIFLYLPILVLIVNSFNESRFGGEWTGFTFKWYERLWEERSLWKALRNSMVIGLSAMAVSTVLGTMAAWALYRFKTNLQKAHYGLIYFPLIIPDILMGISLLLFFVFFHWQLGLFTVFIAHTTFCISYVVMVVLAKLQQFDYSVVEAAQDLGANRWTLFRRIILPLITPGIVSGALLAFTLSLDDFVITFFVAGQGATTLPIFVYSMIKFGSTPVINALSAILLVVTFVIVYVTQSLSEEK
jgi:spermidine/putrescine transport system permease protein